MNYREAIRCELYKKMYAQLSDEDKRAYMQMQNHEETLQALQDLRQQVKSSEHSFTDDLLANIAGNAVFDGAVWLLSKVIKKL